MARPRAAKRAETYRHEEEALLRPDVGTQAQFKKRKPPKTYRYDSSLSPALDWDGGNAARELGEWLLAQIEEASALEPPFVFPEPRRFGDVEVSGLHDAVARLKALSRPFLDWAGKAERLSFDVRTLPLFVHEHLSTKAISRRSPATSATGSCGDAALRRPAEKRSKSHKVFVGLGHGVDGVCGNAHAPARPSLSSSS